MSLLATQKQNIKTVKLDTLGQVRYYQSGILTQLKLIIIQDLYLPIEYYMPTIQALEGQYYILTYDLLSQGQTDTIDRPTMDQYVQQFKYLTDYLLLNKYKYYIIAHGFGCNIVSQLLQEMDYSKIVKIFMFGPQINPTPFPIEKRGRKSKLHFPCPSCTYPVFVIQDEYRELFEKLNPTMLQYFQNDFYRFQQSMERRLFYINMSKEFDRKTEDSYKDCIPKLLSNKQLELYIFENNQFTDSQKDCQQIEEICKKYELSTENVLFKLDQKKYSYFIFITNPLYIKSILDKEENQE